LENLKKTYWVYPTRACNLNCTYCYQQDKKGFDPDKGSSDSSLFMDKETVEQTADFIIRDESQYQKHLQFFGGEPLLAWDTIKFFVARLGSMASFSITTNGTLLNRERLSFLKANGFGFALSIDGPPGVTRKTRPGSEKTPLDLIAEFYPNAQIIITLSPQNIEDGFRSTSWFMEKGFMNIAHNLALEKPWPLTAIRTHHRIFTQLADMYIEKKGEAGFMFVSFAQKAVRNSNFTQTRNICGSNPCLLAIDINGDIYPCQDMVTCDREKKYRLGNVRDEYEKPRSLPLSLMKFPERDSCFKCWFFHQCVGGCGPKNLLVSGDRFQPNMNGCELYARQVSEGMRALLNTGRLALFREKRIER